MKNEDIRIGLRFQYYGGTCEGQIYAIIKLSEMTDDVKIAISIEGGGYTVIDDLNDLTPIPLTEEWLLKFGFEADEQFRHLKLHFLPKVPVKHAGFTEKIEILYGCGADGCHWQLRKNGLIISYLDNVHELQDIYHCFSGEELKLK